MEKLVCVIFCLFSSLVYAAAEEMNPDDYMEVPIDPNSVGEVCCICLDQMTDEEISKNQTMNANKIHDGCSARENYFAHKDCFFKGLKVQILSGVAKIQFKFSSELFADVPVLFYDPTYIVDFLYEYFAKAEESEQEELETLISEYIKNWEKFANRIAKQVPCQNPECDAMYPNPDQDIYYKPVGQICEKCGTIYSKAAFSKLDEETLKNARLCPSCGDIVERIDGCDNMRCGHCKTSFHWSKAGRIKKIAWGSDSTKPPHRSCSLM